MSLARFLGGEVSALVSRLAIGFSVSLVRLECIKS